MGDAAGQDPGLARPGPGHDEQGAAPVDDRRLLRAGESFQQGFCPLRPGRRLPFFGFAAPFTFGDGILDDVLGEEAVVVAGSPSGSGVGLPGHVGHSHSMVPGGLEVMSRATRLTPSTSLMIRDERRSSTS